MTNQKLLTITNRIKERSLKTRAFYQQRMTLQESKKPRRMQLSCGNLAHGFAACAPIEKSKLRTTEKPNVAIVSAYNEMLSAHKPYESFPKIIKEEALSVGAIAQFAGGVPAMCDGVTQGQDGMDLSLFSRDVIAQSTAIALSHNMFDAALLLGICDKIVPGMLMGALSFGHLPVIFVPGGPMPSGLANKEKARIRQLYAEGKATREQLLEAEAQSYHGEGTCTFYGTANTNQMLVEIMGLQLPGSSFVQPHSPLREALTREATRKAIQLSSLGNEYLPLWKIVDERSIVNAIVGLCASGGSTNHTIHLIAIAKAAGIQINWNDFHEISAMTPMLCRVYPNGEADINHFHAAGGTGFLIQELLRSGMLHDEVHTIAGLGLKNYTQEAFLNLNKVQWKPAAAESHDLNVLRPVASPFQDQGGLQLLEGNIGRAIMKTSALKDQHLAVEAEARVFSDQDQFLEAFKKGSLNCDFVAVITHEGPGACGMPELHKLTPALGVLQDKGFKVALVTDGRMSGASGKVPAAIHLTPEAIKGGLIGKIKDGDVIRIDARAGTLQVKLSAAELAERKVVNPDLSYKHFGSGRELFSQLRHCVTAAEDGASTLGLQ
ncbi:MAG: phosphogluconate dehydratase [Deltaproteobacteria bacterium]|jgi:phosphogluconate dehydratase|nr:phosphogluconate dehydratase [Deltaproteobacteria bacterium]